MQLVKIGRQQAKLRITLPNMLRDTMGLQPGMYLSVKRTGKNTIKLTLIDEKNIAKLSTQEE